MKKFKALVEGVNYTFDVTNVESEEDARSTALEHLDLIGMPDWKEHLQLEEVKLEELK